MKKATATHLKELKVKSKVVASLLKIMAHPQRLLILCTLFDGEKTVGEIEKGSGASQSAVSQFLKTMKAEGLVESRRDAQFIYYRLADEKAQRLLQALYQIYCA